MDNRRFNGGNSTKPQRANDKRLMNRSDLESAYSALSPFIPGALIVIENALANNEKWAVETVLKYVYSLPKTDITTTHQTPAFEFSIKDIFRANGNPINIPTSEQDIFEIHKNPIK
jgi:hypothetical protein